MGKTFDESSAYDKKFDEQNLDDLIFDFTGYVKIIMRLSSGCKCRDMYSFSDSDSSHSCVWFPCL